MASSLQQNNSACPSTSHTKVRTDDIKCLEDLNFDDLLLSAPVLAGLKSAGFIRPSPIQVKAIPLGRFGLDLVIQAKSGTGKTCVFSVIALESVSVSSSALQVLILSPTREIAFQSQQVINNIGSQISGLKCHTFIGGIHLSEDLKLLKECHIAVGSPGRIRFLIESGYMKTDSIRLLILDEADMLFTDNFQPTINWVYSSLPSNKQMLTLSATYTPDMIEHLTRYMRNPTYIRLNSTDPTLLGIRQFFSTVPYNSSKIAVFNSKAEILYNLLSSVEFQQCLVFSNYHSSAQDLCESLTKNGWPAAYIASSLDQTQRLKVYEQLKRFHCRILVSTDLTSRGIDAENVNLVVNMEVPWEHETYLHRIGRAGRFGAYGATLTLVAEGEELALLTKIQDQCNTKIRQLPDPIPSDLARPECQLKLDDLITTEQLVSDNIQTQPPPTSDIGIRHKNNSRSSRVKKQQQPSSSSSLPMNGRSSLFDDRASELVNNSARNDFLLKLWQPLDETEEVSAHSLQELLSRYHSEGSSIFSTPPPDDENLCSTNQVVDIPQSLKTPLSDNDNLSSWNQIFYIPSHEDAPKCRVDAHCQTDNNNDDADDEPLPSVGLTDKNEADKPLPSVGPTGNRLQDLDSEFWRLYAWANYYSTKYNELTNFIEETKAKLNLLNAECDDYLLSDCEDEEVDIISGDSFIHSSSL